MVGARLRRWRRNPLLAAHHLATVTLGMAAVSAVLSLMLAIAFQPLPFRDSAQLVQVWNRTQSGAPVSALSGAELVEIQEGTQGVFAHLGGFTPLRLWLLDEHRSAEPLRVARLETSAFRALDLTPVLGEPVGGSESGTAGLGPVWISHRLWQSRYGGRVSVIGETIRLADNETGLHETRAGITGVLPPEIRIPAPGVDGPVDLWAILPDAIKVRAAKASVFFALGRLRPDATVAKAQATMTVLADRRPRQVGRRNRPVVQSLEELSHGPARRTIGVLAIGVAVVLLLAFANLASLSVAESNRRLLELSIRSSLGAGRWQLWRDMVAEYVVLIGCALGLGLPLAWVALQGLTHLVTLANIGPPLPHPPGLNLSVLLGFCSSAMAAALGWSLLIVRGVNPESSSGSLRAGHLPGAAESGPVERRAGWWRLGLLSAQACLGIAVIVMAASMTRVYLRLTDVNLGPNPDRTFFFSVRPAHGGAPTAAQAADFNSQVVSVMRSLPEVEGATFADNFPPVGSPMPFWKQGDLTESPRDATYPLSVANDYFSTLGIPILFGRSFSDSDAYAGARVAIVDLEMARRNWASPKEAVNAQIRVGASMYTYEVIGVAGSFDGYWAQEPMPMIYVSQNQKPSGGGTVILRAGSSTSSIYEHARQALTGMAVRVEMSSAMTLQAGWQATATRPRARMVAMVLLALIGIGLGAQGVYALAASMVAARRQELAIRMALGAPAPALIWLVLRQLIFAVTIGSSIGVAGIFTLQRFAPQWISAAVSEPAVPIALAISVLLATAVLGGFIPARSVTRTRSVAWLRQ